MQEFISNSCLLRASIQDCNSSCCACVFLFRVMNWLLTVVDIRLSVIVLMEVGVSFVESAVGAVAVVAVLWHWESGSECFGLGLSCVSRRVGNSLRSKEYSILLTGTVFFCIWHGMWGGIAGVVFLSSDFKYASIRDVLVKPEEKDKLQGCQSLDRISGFGKVGYVGKLVSAALDHLFRIWTNHFLISSLYFKLLEMFHLPIVKVTKHRSQRNTLGWERMCFHKEFPFSSKSIRSGDRPTIAIF